MKTAIKNIFILIILCAVAASAYIFRQDIPKFIRARIPGFEHLLGGSQKDTLPEQPAGAMLDNLLDEPLNPGTNRDEEYFLLTKGDELSGLARQLKNDINRDAYVTHFFLKK